MITAGQNHKLLAVLSYMYCSWQIQKRHPEEHPFDWVVLCLIIDSVTYDK